MAGLAQAELSRLPSPELAFCKKEWLHELLPQLVQGDGWSRAKQNGALRPRLCLRRLVYGEDVVDEPQASIRAVGQPFATPCSGDMEDQIAVYEDLGFHVVTVMR